MIPGYVEFEFDLPEALLAKLVSIFDAVTAAPLLSSVVSHIRRTSRSWNGARDSLAFTIWRAISATVRMRSPHAYGFCHRLGIPAHRLRARRDAA